jgi:hypothetical protein
VADGRREVEAAFAAVGRKEQRCKEDDRHLKICYLEFRQGVGKVFRSF